MKNKYGNRKCEYDGLKFDSVKERDRYMQLLALQKAGQIAGLTAQVKFELIPKKRRSDGSMERACSYIADFVYSTASGLIIVEDAKGKKTPDYVIKRKLMLMVHNISVAEV